MSSGRIRMTIVHAIKKNWKAGLTVALVSIPLSISLAIASQTTPIVGIITAIWAGLTASILGGSNFNIIGPTGALSGILATFALSHGAQYLPMLAIMAGIFILIAYWFTLERYLIFIPASTIHGFTLGVACIIALSQLNFALGISGLPRHEHFINNVIESFRHSPALSWPTFLIFLASLIFLVLIRKWIPTIPGAIILAPIGIGIGYCSTTHLIPYSFETLETKFGSIAPQLLALPALTINVSLISTAAMVALIAILETMISARIADGMTKTKHNKRKELCGLGIANVVSGLCGGMPATAALARTALNVKSGASSKMAATIASLCIACISLLFLCFFQYLPLALVAALLVDTAARMIEREHFITMYSFDKINFIIALLVAFITVYADPIMGIIFGVACALLIFMEQLSHGHYEITVHEPAKITDESMNGEESSINQDTFIYAFKGQLAYINGQAHLARFENQSIPYKNIILNFKDTYFIDLDGIDTLDEIIVLLTAQKKKVFITNLNPFIKKMVMTRHTIKKLQHDGCIFETTDQALEFLSHQ